MSCLFSSHQVSVSPMVENLNLIESMCINIAVIHQGDWISFWYSCEKVTFVFPVFNFHLFQKQTVLQDNIHTWCCRCSDFQYKTAGLDLFQSVEFQSGGPFQMGWIFSYLFLEIDTSDNTGKEQYSGTCNIVSVFRKKTYRYHHSLCWTLGSREWGLVTTPLLIFNNCIHSL